MNPRKPVGMAIVLGHLQPSFSRHNTRAPLRCARACGAWRCSVFASYDRAEARALTLAWMVDAMRSTGLLAVVVVVGCSNEIQTQPRAAMLHKEFFGVGPPRVVNLRRAVLLLIRRISTLAEWQSRDNFLR
jgi:hypothetical protein